MQGLPGNSLTRILLGISAALAAIIAIELYLLQGTGSLTWHEPPAETTDNNTLTIGTYIAPDIEVFSEILDRPLFVEGRLPPEEPENDQAATPASRPSHFNLLLEGVAITPETRVAVVREINSRKLLRLTEGMEHQGWKLEQVDKMGVTFKNNQEVRELTLEIDTEKKPPIQHGKTPFKPANVAGQPVTLDQIRIKEHTPAPKKPKQIPAP